MANTYTLIASSTVGAGGVADITFSSIPATYIDLLVKVSARTNRTGNPTDAFLVQFNGSTTSVYTNRNVFGDGSTAGSNQPSTTAIHSYGIPTSVATSSTFSNGEIYISNYTSTSIAKSVSIDSVGENNAINADVNLNAGLWNPATQAAISSILLKPSAGTLFLQYSTAYLYGISNS